MILLHSFIEWLQHNRTASMILNENMLQGLWLFHPTPPHLKFNDATAPRPTPPPHLLRSIDHVCKFNDAIAPHATPPPLLRSIDHVC